MACLIKLEPKALEPRLKPRLKPRGFSNNVFKETTSLGMLAMRSAGGWSLTSFHQPHSLRTVEPEQKTAPLQCDKVPEIVPSQVLLFFLQ